MSGEVILFAVMSIIFLVAIVLIEVSHDAKKEASAEKSAETVSEKCICHGCDYVFTADELKKVG